MKVSFIRPNLSARRSVDALEPLCFAILKGLTPPDVECVLHDERLEDIPFDQPTDLVALTVETYTARRAYQIADEYRRRGVKVVIGGYHPTFLPEEGLEHADAVVQGDAEGAWERVLADARTGRVSGIYKAETLHPLKGLAYDRSIFAGKNYGPMRMVQYGRGCKWNCDFCSIRAFYGTSLRQRPVSELVAELEAMQPRHVFLVDDNIFVDMARAKELFRALTPLRIQWSTQVSIDVAKDAELVDLMAKSGCTVITVGFESLDERSLQQMKKHWNTRFGGYDACVARLRDAGIMIYGTFLVGYDHDTPAAFDAAVEFAQKHRFMLGNFNPLTPMPGTPLLDRLTAEGRMIWDKWWLAPGFKYGDATFHPKGMTADELTNGCFEARKKFYSPLSIARRMLDTKTNARSLFRVGLHLSTNFISRREILAKQGIGLGEVAWA